MLYFSPEDSKKLEELGLDSMTGFRHIKDEDGDVYEWSAAQVSEYQGTNDVILGIAISTLDICELENAKKLWGEEESCSDYGGIPKFEQQLENYITLSDEERIKYVADYLSVV